MEGHGSNNVDKALNLVLSLDQQLRFHLRLLHVHSQCRHVYIYISGEPMYFSLDSFGW